MLVPKDTVLKAKNDLGEQAAVIIAEDLQLEGCVEPDFKALCPFHPEDTPSFVFSKKDNAFKCFGCGRRYGIIDHYIQHNGLTYLGAVQKLFELTETKFSFGEKGIKTERDYRYPSREQNDSRQEVEEYLQTRSISKTTLDMVDVQQDSNHNIVFHYYDTNDVLTLVKYRPARKVDKGEKFKSWCQKDTDTMPLLYNMNRVDFTNGPLLICEGEIDCLAAIESGYKNSVSVPLGANNYGWIETNWEWLELFDKIVVWADSDEAGFKMRKEVCQRLGVWRTLYVDAPSKVVGKDGSEVKAKDINEVLHYCGSQKVLDLINDAKELPITGIDDLSTVDDFDIETAEGLYTNLAPLDKIVYKILYGSVALITGKRGAGKSSFVNQVFVCEPLDQGQDVFYFSGELSAPVLKSWIELTMAGREHVKMKDNSDFVRIMDVDARKEMRQWYKGRVWVYKEVDNSETIILEKAISVTRKYGVKVWILDNLMTIGLNNASEKDLLQKQKEFIVKLNRLSLLYGVLIVLIAHPRKTMTGQELGSDDIAGSGDIPNLAQYIFSIKRYSQKEKDGEKDGKGGYRKGKEPTPYDTEVETMKNRYSGRIGLAKLYFDYTSYRFYNNTKELFRRYKWNKDTSPLPTQDPNHHEQLPDIMRE